MKLYCVENGKTTEVTLDLPNIPMLENGREPLNLYCHIEHKKNEKTDYIEYIYSVGTRSEEGPSLTSYRMEALPYIKPDHKDNVNSFMEFMRYCFTFPEYPKTS